MKLAVPSYFYPGPLWGRMLAKRPGLVIINPNSGPGGQFDGNYAETVRLCNEKKIKVLGYVATTYAEKSVIDVYAEMDRYLHYYSDINGYFFDETTTDKAHVAYYKNLLRKELINVLNPGTWPDESYARLPAILMTSETNMAKYLADKPPKWTMKYSANKFWHCIFGVPTLEDALKVKKLAIKRRAGYLFVTDDDDDAGNGYDSLPAYWEKL